MRFFRDAVLLIFVLPLSAQAAFTDFDDLTPRDAFGVGETFVSKGLAFDVVSNYRPIGPVTVVGFGPHRGLALFGLGLDFQLPANTQLISLLYDASDASSNMIINGIATPNIFVNGTATPNVVGFSSFDGTTVADVSISTDVHSQSFSHGGNLAGEFGFLTLSGPITSFVIGGVEMGINDVSIIVPEPSSLLLLLLGLPFLSRLRAFGGNKGVKYEWQLVRCWDFCLTH